MKLLRLIGKSLSDVFEHLLTFIVASVLWWLCVLSVVLAPPATVALFAFTDPRRSIDRPEFAEVRAGLRRQALASWKLSLATIPFVALLVWNLGFYGGTDNTFALLAPLWFVLLLAGVAITLCANAVMGLTGAPIGSSLRQAAFVALGAPFATVIVLVVILVYVLAGIATVVPLVLIVPPLVTSLVNRLVLRQLRIPVLDPLTPTEERLHEEQRRRASKGH
ncbi:MAG: hypothetical protein WKF80_09830 [Thermomicrobiales bacterium]